LVEVTFAWEVVYVELGSKLVSESHGIVHPGAGIVVMELEHAVDVVRAEGRHEHSLLYFNLMKVFLLGGWVLRGV